MLRRKRRCVTRTVRCFCSLAVWHCCVAWPLGRRSAFYCFMVRSVIELSFIVIEIPKLSIRYSTPSYIYTKIIYTFLSDRVSYVNFAIGLYLSGMQKQRNMHHTTWCYHTCHMKHGGDGTNCFTAVVILYTSILVQKLFPLWNQLRTGCIALQNLVASTTQRKHEAPHATPQPTIRRERTTWVASAFMSNCLLMVHSSGINSKRNEPGACYQTAVLIKLS